MVKSDIVRSVFSRFGGGLYVVGSRFRDKIWCVQWTNEKLLYPTYLVTHIVFIKTVVLGPVEGYLGYKLNKK